MNIEQLIAKGVKKHFTGQETLFEVESLKEHYDGLQIHESDILLIDEVEYLKADDINDEYATPNDVESIEEIEVVGDIEVEDSSNYLDQEEEELD
jgi:hypothetical protein